MERIGILDKLSPSLMNMKFLQDEVLPSQTRIETKLAIDPSEFN